MSSIQGSSYQHPPQQQQQQEPQSDNREIQEIDETDVMSRFDAVSDPSDHLFLNHQGYNNNVIIKRVIMREWKILKQHLPDTIYVRVYENRIDLMRAAIVGAAGTPYHDGLFFFDIAFPVKYPAVPPKVLYRSFGMRINPNLYANGAVCLSLLNTWSGHTEDENWIPGKSTTLQVLLSIQALVLNEKPYYNEPDVWSWLGKGFWEPVSSSYNEDVFVYNCKTMLCLMRKPPKNFEAFVAKYFRDRACVILSACNAYKNGRVKVGYYNTTHRRQGSASSSSSSSSSDVTVSREFKKAMTELLPRLLDAFSKCGASLENLDDELKKVEKDVAAAPNTQARIVKKVSRMCTWFFGL